MANRDSPDGLRAVRRKDGGAVALSAHTIAGGHATAIFSGDLVKHTGTGRNIDRCAAGDRSCGVFHGCEFIDTNGDVQFKRYWPASQAVKTGTTVIAWVFDDPNVLFEVQGSAALTETMIGNVADIVTTAGNTSSGQSDMELDVATVAASGSAQLKIYGLIERDDNAYGANARVLVLINEHEYVAAITAV